MKRKLIDWLYWLLAFLPLIVTGIAFPYYPATIPAHFDSAGQVNRYGSKAELFILPAITLVIALLNLLFFNYSKKHQNKKHINLIHDASKFVIIVVFNVLTYILLGMIYNAIP
jgi:uncharacterized membrane protein